MEEIMEDEKDRSATTADRQQGEVLTESSSTGTQEDNQVPKSDQSLDPPL